MEIFIDGYEKVTEEMLSRLPSLKLIACCRGNPVNIDLQAAARRGIPVVYTPGRNANGVAEFTIGLMLADTAMHMGLTVMISELADGRLALARKIGVTHVIDAKKEDASEAALRITEGVGPNIVCDCAGVPKMAEEAFRILSPAGRFVPVAGVKFECDGYIAMRKQLKIVASRLQMHQFVPVIARFKLYQEHAQQMITDVYDFDDTKKAFEYASERHPETGKIVLRFHKAEDVQA